jgi:hypothetical protein
MSKALAEDRDEQTDEVEARPWQRAVKAFIRLRAKPNQTIPLDWFIEEFELTIPTRGTVEDWTAFRFGWLGAFDKFRRELLEKHFIDLRPVKTKGYQVVPPNEQTRCAIEDGLKDVGRVLDKMNARILYVNHKALTKRERRENLEALHRMHLMRQALTKRHALSGLIGRRIRNKGLSEE